MISDAESNRRVSREKTGEADWHDILAGGINRAAAFSSGLNLDQERLDAVGAVYPMFINAYYAAMIGAPGDPFGRQVIPDIRELEDRGLVDDPLAEGQQSPVAGIIHRYPDRVVLLVSGRCPILCRFCLRKRSAGGTADLTDDELRAALAYIRERTGIREVILSGGDPLLLEDRRLDGILTAVRALPHVRIIRIHSRTPCALPQRITADLARMLKKHHPLYVNVHFNHPDEITEAAAGACIRLVEAGIPLGSQTVLLKGVNDSADIIGRLLTDLLTIRVRPYYLHHPDPIRGTAHFRVPVKTGLAIMKSLRGRVPGTAMPHYVIDLPGGGGKVPLLPEYILGTAGGMMTVRNFKGERFQYPLE